MIYLFSHLIARKIKSFQKFLTKVPTSPVNYTNTILLLLLETVNALKQKKTHFCMSGRKMSILQAQIKLHQGYFTA